MCQNGVSHHARAEEVLLCDVIYRKLHPDHYGGPLCCGNDALRRWRNRTGKNYHVSESEWLEQQGAVTKKNKWKSLAGTGEKQLIKGFIRQLLTRHSPLVPSVW